MMTNVKEEGYWPIAYRPVPCDDPKWVAVVELFTKRLDTVEGLARRLVKKDTVRCRLCGHLAGSSDICIDDWAWPQELRHYIFVHRIRPSQDFINLVLSKTQDVPLTTEEKGAYSMTAKPAAEPKTAKPAAKRPATKKAPAKKAAAKKAPVRKAAETAKPVAKKAPAKKAVMKKVVAKPASRKSAKPAPAKVTEKVPVAKPEVAAKPVYRDVPEIERVTGIAQIGYIGFFRAKEDQVSPLPWPYIVKTQGWTKAVQQKFVARLALLQERVAIKKDRGSVRCALCETRTHNVVYQSSGYHWTGALSHYVTEHGYCVPRSFYQFVLDSTSAELPPIKAEENFGK